MTGIKSKRDVVVSLLLIAFLLGFLYLVFFISGWWALSAPVYWLVAMFLSACIASGKIPKIEREVGTSIHTRILTVGGDSKPCVIIVRPTVILIKSKGNLTKIPMHSLATVMFEDKSVSDMSMAGFGIDYRDSTGTARVMFFNQGPFSVRRTRKSVALIQDTHQNWCRTNRSDAVTVIDVSASKKQIANSVVHRVE